MASFSSGNTIAITARPALWHPTSLWLDFERTNDVTPSGLYARDEPSSRVVRSWCQPQARAVRFTRSSLVRLSSEQVHRLVVAVSPPPPQLQTPLSCARATTATFAATDVQLSASAQRRPEPWSRRCSCRDSTWTRSWRSPSSWTPSRRPPCRSPRRRGAHCSSSLQGLLYHFVS
jgi:hypothetical protein